VGHAGPKLTVCPPITIVLVRKLEEMLFTRNHIK